ncbi:MAG: biosynthetic arginine decarboxylase [Acidobacteriia bacterium]|nr:biosynthetic arginine decarboxylase [Terriglobia bacterium]
MNVPATDRFTVDDAVNLYGLDGWGNGYLAVGTDGHLLVTPSRDPSRAIDVVKVVEDLGRRGFKTPLLLRYPQLLEGQVHELANAFANAIREFSYPERYLPVFPIKVNQQRSVVEGLVASGWRYGLGLEVGSRPELLAAIGLPTSPEALLICNGFKDPDYLSSASLATRLGKQVVVVVEKPFEVDQILELAREEEVLPKIGFRIRLQSKGSGKWEKSSGFASKFGLTTLQLMRALDKLSQAGLSRSIALLHFHVGSQVTEIRRIKNAVREAARIYAKVRKAGADIAYLDVGGGLGIDYDGSKTSSDASVNYTVQEYANDVVFGIAEVCSEEHVPPPTITSESGRMLVGYHAMLVTDVRGIISGIEPDPPALTGREPQVVQDLAEVARKISVKNYREFYHDAIEYRDQMYQLFNLGMLGLEDRAKAETLFWETAGKAVRFSKSAKFVADEFVELEQRLHDKYICNFSVFQSLPDHWALDQLFPVIPVHRLNEPPTRRATLVDITCDSDGEVEKFVDLKDIKDALEVHDMNPGEPYYLAFLLVGAYQDTMGDMHNLFGRVHEAEVILDPMGSSLIRDTRRGEPASETLACFGYDEGELTETVAVALRERVNRGELGREDADGLLDDYRQRLTHYTYLD